MTAKEKADRSYLARKGNGEEPESKLWNFVLDFKHFDQLKRIIGAPKELDDIESSDLLKSALSYMLKHTILIDAAIIKGR